MDARRLKNDITGEIRRTRALLGESKNQLSDLFPFSISFAANHEKDEWINGEKTEDIVAYLDRLYTAKRKVEKRIGILGGVDDSVNYLLEYRDHFLTPNIQKPLSVHEGSPLPETTHRFSLRDVLTNPSSLSYFMEFMDRRNRSLLVQFWLTVESFKNPLEPLDSSGSEDEKEGIIEYPKSPNAAVKEDMTMLYDLYFSMTSSLATLSVSQRHIDSLRAFVLDESLASLARERQVRRSVLRAQKEVEEELEQDFQNFERSDLWFRAIADLEPRSSARKTPQRASSPSSGAAIRDNASGPSTITRERPRLLESKRYRRPKFLLSPAQRTESAPTIANTLETASRTTSDVAISGVTGRPSLDSTNSSGRISSSNLDLLMSPGPEDSPRLPLFDEPGEPSSPGLSELGQEEPSIEQMAAIKAALTDIIADDNRRTSDPHRRVSSTSAMSEPDLANDDRYSTKSNHQHHRPGLFDNLDDEPDMDAEHAEETTDRNSGNFELAGPGDLQLSYDIDRLTEKISKLQSQDAMLDTLIRKAELTGDAQELQLLDKSKSATVRELRELTFQKAQYEQQEADNRLIPDRTKVAIANSAVGDDDGRAVVRYLVEVQQLAADGSFSSGWVVARRYSEFFNMHQALKEKYLIVRNLEFPGKRLVTSLSSSFVDTRRIGLEKYLQVRLFVNNANSPHVRRYLESRYGSYRMPKRRASFISLATCPDECGANRGQW